jgi:hypothetical protein
MAAKGKKLTPAQLAAQRFGGIRPLGRLLGIDPSAISKWIARGGDIPNRASGNTNTHKRLLELAKEHGVKLTVQELTFGGQG